MKKIFMLILMSFIGSANATDISCGGIVTAVMGHVSQCGGKHMAFTTSITEGTKWYCSPSVSADSILLTAITTGKTVTVFIESPYVGATCLGIPHYTNIKYVIQHKQ